MSRRSGITKMPAAFDRAAELARKAGWTIVAGKRGHHIQWKPPGSREIIVTSSTPSGCRTTANELAQLRRAGLRI